MNIFSKIFVFTLLIVNQSINCTHRLSQAELRERNDKQAAKAFAKIKSTGVGSSGAALGRLYDEEGPRVGVNLAGRRSGLYVMAQYDIAGERLEALKLRLAARAEAMRAAGEFPAAASADGEGAARVKPPKAKRSGGSSKKKKKKGKKKVARF